MHVTRYRLLCSVSSKGASSHVYGGGPAATDDRRSVIGRISLERIRSWLIARGARGLPRAIHRVLGLPRDLFQNVRCFDEPILNFEVSLGY